MQLHAMPSLSQITILGGTYNVVINVMFNTAKPVSIVSKRSEKK
jgi:hypothetical protein